jgi:hypothetical protein
MTLADFSKAGLLACLFPGFLLLGADDTAPPLRRLTIGIHAEYFPTRLISTGSAEVISTNPVAQSNYTASSNSPKWGPGAVVEYRLTKHLAVAGELHFHHDDYQQTTNLLSGPNTSTSGGDNRPLTIMVETSQVNLYEIPVLAHYYGLWDHGWKRRIFLSGGVEWRKVGKIRTANDFTLPSGATDYNENPAIPNHANTFGAVAGVGMRFVDEFHIRISPEFRFTRWESPALQGPAYHSLANQMEADLSISF